jgi:hypothetical protein
VSPENAIVCGTATEDVGDGSVARENTSYGV